MNWKSIIKGFIVILVLISIWALISILLPVGYDAGVCGSGFKSYIAHKYIKELDVMVLQELGDNYELMSGIETMANSMKWEGREIKCNLQYKIYGKTMNGIVIIHFKGKRYWYERYDWKILLE